MKRISVLIALAFTLLSLKADAQVYMDQWKFGFGGLYPRLLGTDAGGEEFNYGGYLNIEFDMSEHVGFRVKPFYTHLIPQAKDSKTDLFGAGLGLNYYFVPNYSVTPYLSFGFSGFAQNMIKPQSGKEEMILDYSADLGLGVTFKNLLGKNWDLNAEFGYHSVANDRLDGKNGAIGGMLGGQYDSYMDFTLGLNYNFNFGPTSKYYPGANPKEKLLPIIERYPVYANSWQWGFGFLYPRYVGTEVLGKEFSYGGYLHLTKKFNEYVSFRIKPFYAHIQGSANGQSTDLANGQLDILYKFLPYEPVTPYIGMGGSVVGYAVNKPSSTSMKDGEWYLDYGLNLLLGADWKLFSESWEINTEVAYLTVASDRLDGHIDMSSPIGGFLGGPYDSYMTFSLGLNLYLDRGDKAEGLPVYDGMAKKDDVVDKDKDKGKEKEVQYEPVDYDKIEQIVEKIVQKYQTEPVDYNRIEDLINKNSGKNPNQSWVLYGVNFDFNSARLRPESYPVLNHAAQVLLSNTDVKVEIGGHTDAVGSESNILILSEKRAEAVKTYLVGKGVSADRLTVQGYGASMPVADNATAEGRALNRRVEFKVIE